MGPMNLYRVEASLHSPPGSGAKSGDDLMNLLAGDLPRGQAENQRPDRRGSNRLFLLKKIETLPPSVMKLQGHFASGSMDCFGNFSQARDKLVVKGSQLVRC